MNGYKNIIKSPKIRKQILDMLYFLPDKAMLKIQYRIKLGRKLNLENPQRFTEKLQWYKLNYRNPLMRECVDKYIVRKYVESKGLKNILVPLIKKYELIEEINLDELPDEFVMKTTNGSGGLNVIVCNDKSEMDIEEIKKKLESSDFIFKKNSGGREWAYYGLRRRIIIEKRLINKQNPEAGIDDYKFFCYEGVPKYIIVDVDRYIGHKRNFYDTEWNNLHIESDCPKADREIPKPKNLDKMIKVASKLSEDFPYVRVDLYNVEGEIYFGELTFYPWSGYVQYIPDKADYMFGEDFPLRMWGGNERNFVVVVIKCNFVPHSRLECVA